MAAPDTKSSLRTSRPLMTCRVETATFNFLVQTIFFSRIPHFHVDVACLGIMDSQEPQVYLAQLANAASEQFHKIPGSAIFLRYVQSSYQNDPVRSAVELFLVLFAIRYLLAPKYSTKPNYVKLSEEVSARQLGCNTELAPKSWRRKSTTSSMNGHRNLSSRSRRHLKRLS